MLCRPVYGRDMGFFYYGPDPMLSVIAAVVIIAAVAALLDYSVAMGAFFAGLAFSRDTNYIRKMTSYKPLVDLFSPFFFIGIGIGVNFGIYEKFIILGLILCTAAVVGKMIGVGLPALIEWPFTAALLLGLSMVPRAEITIIILDFAHRNLSDFPEEIYFGMVLTVILTCTVPPLILKRYIDTVEN